MQQHDFDCLEEDRFGRPPFALQPFAEISLGNLQVCCQLFDPSQDKAGPVKRAREDARLLGRRQRAVLGSGRLLHNGYRAALASHSQVASTDNVLSICGERRVDRSRAEECDLMNPKTYTAGVYVLQH